MAIAELFETAIEDMEENTLPMFLISLLKSADLDRLSHSRDKARFLAIVRYLLGVADFQTREQVAQVALTFRDLPSDVYLYFACDHIQIARTFLRPSFTLSEGDLVHVAKFCGREHRLELLNRSDLTPTIRQEIMRHNEVDVIRAMNELEGKAVFFEYDDTISVEEPEPHLQGFGFDVDEDPNIENPLDLMLKGFVKNSRFADVIEILAKHGDLSKEMVKGMFSRKEADPISIYCRGIGVGPEAFAELARFRCRRLGQMERLAENAIEAYSQISDDYAQAMLVDLKAQAPQIARKLSR